ncbi:MAG: hypothetical protein QXP13_05430 [Candidatus Methanomethylicia archaeon]
MGRASTENRHSFGASEIIGNLIIAATIMVITIISANLAFTIIEVQAAQAEFESIKDSMIILADIIEEVSSRMYSSGYVKFNCKYGRIDFLKDNVHVEVYLITEINSTKIIDDYTSSIRYTSSLSFSVVDEYIRGSSGIGIGEYSQVISIRTLMSYGFPSIILSGGSIRFLREGEIFLFSRGIYTNVYELVFIRLKIGLTFGSGSINVKAYSKNVLLKTFFVDSNGILKLFLNGVLIDSKGIISPAILYVALLEVELSTV